MPERTKNAWQEAQGWSVLKKAGFASGHDFTPLRAEKLDDLVRETPVSSPRTDESGEKTDFSGDFQRPNLMMWEILDKKFFEQC